MKDYNYEYKNWLQYKNLDKEMLEELELIKDKTEEIEERFYKDLEFGTGGLRGLIGAGTNRMNIYTIRKLTLALANYIISQGAEAMQRGVAIAYDSRKFSKEFAEETAKVLATNKIKVYLFNDIRPLPLLSFTIRYLKTFSGVVITASHNPSTYNGYKVYNMHGSQITESIAEQLHNEINKITNMLDIPVIGFEKAIKDKMIIMIGEEIDSEYIKNVKNLLLNKDYINEFGNNLKVVYTPLHGTGNMLVKRVLKEINFNNLYTVKEQEDPHPDFPTVSAPNPEDTEVFNLAIKLAEEKEVDIIMGTDPDADRLGVLVNVNGRYQALNGNQLGVIVLNYLLSERKAQGTLTKDYIVIKTIVTSELGRKIADKYEIKTEDTLTGFKYIGEKINNYELEGEKNFLFGYEESFGYLAGDFVRDKDAVQIAALIVEMAIFYKQKGHTLFDILENIYKQYGYFAEELVSISLEGINGSKKIAELLDIYRKCPPNDVNCIKVKRVEDYLDGNTSKVDLPKSNVIKLILEDDSWIALRPSGTEPKIKIYFSVVADSYIEVSKKLSSLKSTIINSLNLSE
ncbi:MAG: phospho-sugar mutase [Vulcanibacillus sp.]